MKEETHCQDPGFVIYFICMIIDFYYNRSRDQLFLKCRLVYGEDSKKKTHDKITSNRLLLLGP